MTDSFEVTHKYDDDSGLVEFLVDGEEICCWNCDDEEGLELSIQDFNKILAVGAKQADARIAEQQRVIDEAMEVVKAVAHIGVDFGYGKYEIEPEKIDLARKLYERSIGENNG